MNSQNLDLFHIHLEPLLPFVLADAVKAIGAIVILLVGLWLSGRAYHLVSRMLTRTPHFDEMLRGFFASLARYGVLTITVLAVLSQFGIQTTSLVAVLGAAGLAVGLALQGTLSNLAAGVMLLIFRPFHIGHKVQVGGIIGTVRDLSLFWTEIVTEENIQVIVPNAGVWGQPLRNFSVYPGLPTAGEVHLRLSDTTNLEEKLEVVRAIAGAHPDISPSEPVKVMLNTVADGPFEIILGFKTLGDTAVIRSDLLRQIADSPVFQNQAPAEK